MIINSPELVTSPVAATALRLDRAFNLRPRVAEAATLGSGTQPRCGKEVGDQVYEFQVRLQT
jgi:hypothetical protein